jgi:hypothetical protein
MQSQSGMYYDFLADSCLYLVDKFQYDEILFSSRLSTKEHF